ncbi:kinesin-like protein KIN-10C isoform X1 [Amborella trichopoda]|uniref:kinesin-like protein KIN-10C isoform X1 n=1 Tax=Amborella trichopoda TaxID=13333 RepID=UPI0009BE2764|nr:kinesin-like protein KIN-10C isoform X1 [Amborella trichopoda]|eukprot:XP_020524079.1 kinesin-like protein KIN-10C isoform X1 [Amborella trichopoda]
MATPAASRTPKTVRFSPCVRYFPSGSDAKIRVIVRIRPFLASEIKASGGNPIPCTFIPKPEGDRGQEVTLCIKDQETSRRECYKLDSCYGQDEDLASIFSREVRPIFPGLFQGINATVFAYGATGSGKTYTMQGANNQPGLMFLAMSEILSICERTGSSVKLSYYEVYLERCYDLLEPKMKEIMVLEDHNGQVQLKDLSQVPVNSMEEFSEIFANGVQRRKVGHTGLNDVSSRSHGVLMLSITAFDKGSGIPIVGKLNLIDLAGNEDNRRTCNEGIRLQESSKINKSLFALSNVIYALNCNEPRVPYRESKLTRILQDSLGRGSRAVMIACLNPSAYQEAVHTVSLAARSRQIVNYAPSDGRQDTPRPIVDMEERLRAWLEAKGKTLTHSSQKHRSIFSPVLRKAQTPLGSVRGFSNSRSSVKSRATSEAVSCMKGRKLFDSQCAITTAMKEVALSNASAVGELCALDKDATFEKYMKYIEKVDNSIPDVNVLDSSKESYSLHNLTTKERSLQNEESYPHHDLTIEEPTLQNEVVAISNASPVAESCTLDKENSAFYGLTAKEQSKQVEIICNEGHKEDLGHTCCLNQLKPLTGQILDEENVMTPSITFKSSSPANSTKSKTAQKQARNALSPIRSNITLNPWEDYSISEPLTPNTTYVVNDKDEKLCNSTPFDKFNERSSGIKNSLVQEYIQFLNTARKDELMKLKWIGEKRADYILRVREETQEPIKELCDLEKIGLSSKQVQDMFRRVARGIFS